MHPPSPLQLPPLFKLDIFFSLISILQAVLKDIHINQEIYLEWVRLDKIHQMRQILMDVPKDVTNKQAAAHLNTPQLSINAT